MFSTIKLCPTCKIYRYLPIRNTAYCNKCFKTVFLEGFRFKVEGVSNNKSLIVFDGSLASSILFYLLNVCVSKETTENLVCISNVEMPYPNILIKQYTVNEIPARLKEWLRVYNCERLIEADSINKRIKTFLEAKGFNTWLNVESIKPFKNIFDDELHRFYTCFNGEIYSPVQSVSSALNGVHSFFTSNFNDFGIEKDGGFKILLGKYLKK